MKSSEERNTLDEERDYDEDEPLLDEEAVVDMFLGESTRAAELRVLRKTLESRRRAFQKELLSTSDEKESDRLQVKIKEMSKQIQVLGEEEAISEFVERSVRMTLQKPREEEFD